MFWEHSLKRTSDFFLSRSWSKAFKGKKFSFAERKEKCLEEKGREKLLLKEPNTI